jgi:CheY-like chemotaxis protein
MSQELRALQSYSATDSTEPGAASRYRILVADDDKLVRLDLISSLESIPEVEICGHAASARETVRQARRTKPDLVILGMNLRAVSGVETVRRIRSVLPGTEVLVVTLCDSLSVGARKEIPQNDLRFCAAGCCHFVNSRPTSQSEYELSARAYGPSLDLRGPMETLIPCRKTADRIQYETENSVGFYLGSRLPRTTGIPLLQDSVQVVIDRTTGALLRVATDEDLRRWNVARRQAAKAAKSTADRTPSLLQIPIGQPKS